MQPEDLTLIGDELAVRWRDGGECFIRLETLRRFCPCASCMGEKDVLGNVYRPEARPLVEASFRLSRLDRVGAYGVQPRWEDGHGTGIYTWDYLRRLGEADAPPSPATTP